MRIVTLIILGLLVAVPTAGAAPFTLFPVVGGATYTDDYGAARGSRSHEGNDLMATCGTPTVAVVSGTVQLDYGSRSGWMLTLRGADTWYRYIHMDGRNGAKSAFAKGLRDGSRVKAGQIIAFVGNTGDAAGGPCHLHFELHYGAYRTVSPYRYLRAATVLNVDPADPTALTSAEAGVTLTIKGTVLWAATVGNDGRIVVRATSIATSAGGKLPRKGLVALKASPELVATIRAGRKVIVTTAQGAPSDERMGLPPLAWTAASVS